MNDKDKTHLPYAGFGVGDFNRLLPEMADNLLHNLPGMAYRCLNDENWTMLFISGGCEIVTGYHPKDLLYGAPKQYGKLIYPEDLELVNKAVQEGLKQNRHFQMVYRIFHKDGSLRWVWEQGIGVLNPHNSTFYLDGLIMDITQTRELEERLEANLIQMEEHNLFKDKLLYSMLHSLLDPVFSFISLSDFISQNFERFSSEQLLEMINQMSDSAKEMHLLLGNLSQWITIQKQSAGNELGLLRLKDAIKDSLNLYKQQMEKKNLQLNLEIEEDILIRADMVAFSNILNNLISNAIKYSHPGHEISIRSSHNDDNVRISFEDQGVGIPASQLKKLFLPKEEYTRPGTQSESGTGIGLLMVKNILKSIGGKIEVKSKVNKGSTFTIVLPIVKR